MNLAITVSLTPDQEFVLLMGALIFWALVTGATMIAVVRSATLPPPVALVIALTTVTLLTIAAFVITQEQELATLAGMGLGALSGAVAATWQQHATEQRHQQEKEIIEMKKDHPEDHDGE